MRLRVYGRKEGVLLETESRIEMYVKLLATPQKGGKNDHGRG